MRLCQGSNRVTLWVLSAVLVVIVRVLHAAPIGYDLSLQIQASHNLLAGRGLTIYSEPSANLVGPAPLTTLTHFPCGYSVVAAALLGMGFSIAAVVKALGAFATILGWLGWGRFAGPFFDTRRGKEYWWAAALVAFLTPIFFTPQWGGTDIFLWATIPWVLPLIVGPSLEDERPIFWKYALAGALCGAAVLMRYASLFLAIYAAVLIAWQSRFRFVPMVQRGAMFALGLLPAALVQGYVNYIVTSGPARPGGLTHGLFASGALERLWTGIQSLPTANYAWAYWLPGVLQSRLFPEVSPRWPWQAAVAFVALLMLAGVVRSYLSDRATPSRDLKIGAMGLLVAVPVFLVVSTVLGSYTFVSDLRYYWPLVPVSVLAAYSCAPGAWPRRLSSVSVLSSVCGLYVAGYLAGCVLYGTFLFLPGQVGDVQRQKFVGGDPAEWPSMAVTQEFSPARRAVIALMGADADSLLISSKSGWFYWDPVVEQSRLRELNCDRLQASYVKGPARVVILSFDKGDPLDLWYYGGNGIEGGLFKAACYERLSDRTVVQRFPDEGVKILEARIESGERITLKP